MTAPSWVDSALCAQTDPSDEVWFPGKGQSTSTARRICRLCPVQDECRAEALADPSLTHGVWGGTTPKMRQQLRVAS